MEREKNNTKLVLCSINRFSESPGRMKDLVDKQQKRSGSISSFMEQLQSVSAGTDKMVKQIEEKLGKTRLNNDTIRNLPDESTVSS